MKVMVFRWSVLIIAVLALTLTASDPVSAQNKNKIIKFTVGPGGTESDEVPVDLCGTVLVQIKEDWAPIDGTEKASQLKLTVSGPNDPKSAEGNPVTDGPLTVREDFNKGETMTVSVSSSTGGTARVKVEVDFGRPQIPCEFSASFEPEPLRNNLSWTWTWLSKRDDKFFVVERPIGDSTGYWGPVQGCILEISKDISNYTCSDSDLKESGTYDYRLCVVDSQHARCDSEKVVKTSVNVVILSKHDLLEQMD